MRWKQHRLGLSCVQGEKSFPHRDDDEFLNGKARVLLGRSDTFLVSISLILARLIVTHPTGGGGGRLGRAFLV
jgi:hypothetical protein